MCFENKNVIVVINYIPNNKSETHLIYLQTFLSFDNKNNQITIYASFNYLEF